MHAYFPFDFERRRLPRHSISRRIRTKAQHPSTIAVTHSLSFAVPATLKTPIMTCISFSLPPFFHVNSPLLLQARTHVRGFAPRHTGEPWLGVCGSFTHPFFFPSGQRTLLHPSGELIGARLRHVETAPAAPVAVVAGIASETVTARRTKTKIKIKTRTRTGTEIVIGIGMTVGIGIETEEIESVTLGIRRGTTTVAAGVPIASVARRPAPSRTMTSLGPHFHPERVKILACLPFVRIRRKSRIVACLVAVCLCLGPQFWFCSPVSQNVQLFGSVPLSIHDSYFTVVS
jgi:hypothetical protein